MSGPFLRGRLAKAYRRFVRHVNWERRARRLADAEAAVAGRVVAALQEDQRTVLELAYFEGLSLVEIGERLAVPVGTVKSRLSRALDKLRATLQEPPRAAAG
ncbi:sigma-70 family RNA polymerase sigma factor [Sorangium sp. So ce128]|uniref:sigma-70 family RNA polymerase sigma factor n=1 Tax=Sorangium sp. So ce128 TaxID=3133281 RepID=UPI003F6047D2